MSQPPASADLKARVARLQPCDCKHNWTEPHLTIELDLIPLQRGDATAISYVWGEFDRRDVPIGHPPGKSDDVIRMNLGIEWVTQDVIHRLVEIAADKPIWMDQMCIPQNDEDIRKILASIATIYKTFDVAVLLPGHPCACLPRIVKELEARAAKGGKDHTPDRSSISGSKKADLCLNVCPLSSWMSRLWTFQELGFSQSVRCVWVSKDVAKCVVPFDKLTEVSGPEDVRLINSIVETDLQPYSRIMFQRTVSAYLETGGEEYTTVEFAWWHLRQLSMDFLRQIHCEINSFTRSDWKKSLANVDRWIESIRAYEHLTLYRFLSGEVIQREEISFLESRPGLKLFKRIDLLRRRTMPRKATHARDYVIAIFAEVPGYSPPPNYKNEELPMLLQHAMDWHRRENDNIWILSTAPQGLFMPDAAESFLWRPAYYLSPDRIRTVNDVYQSLTYSIVQSRNVGLCNVVPLSYRSAGCIPLSAAAKSRESFHGDFADPDSVHDVAAQLRNTIQGWTNPIRSRIGLTFIEERSRQVSGESDPNDFLRLPYLCLCLVEEKGIQEQDYMSRHFSTAELYLAFYDLVCRALYVDVEFCRETGVKLMFSPPTEYRQHPRVGLCRGDVRLGGEQAPDPGHIMAHQSLTVGFRDVEFEAERVNDHEGNPAYRVFGVWVPMKDKFENDIGAVYDLENPSMDALLL